MTIPYVYILLEHVQGGRLMFPGVPWVRWAQGKGLGQGSGVGLVSPTPPLKTYLMRNLSSNVKYLSNAISLRRA